MRTYRWVEQVPVRVGADALAVNWCEITVVQEDTGKQLYHNAWITSHELGEKTVPQVAAAGRAHWKVENENFPVRPHRRERAQEPGLPLSCPSTDGEHNYGHGKQHLSAVLPVLDSADVVASGLPLSHRATCVLYTVSGHPPEAGSRRTFFNDLRTLTRYFYFTSWDQLLAFMYRQLELAPG